MENEIKRTEFNSRCMKITARGRLLRRLTGTQWGANASTLRTTALALVYAPAEYCAPVWCRSSHTHLVDTCLNDAMRTVTGCLLPTPKDCLPVLAGIQPPERRRAGATLKIAYKALTWGQHLLHEIISRPHGQGPPRLKSRRPFVPAALSLLETSRHERAAAWIEDAWSTAWRQKKTALHTYLELRWGGSKRLSTNGALAPARRATVVQSCRLQTISSTRAHSIGLRMEWKVCFCWMRPQRSG